MMRKLIAIAIVFVGLLSVIAICYIGILFYPVSSSATNQPIVQDEFFFHKEGEVREYTFRPRIFKDYNVAVRSNPPFPVKEQFFWSVKYQLYRGKRLVKEGYLKEQTRTFEKATTTVKSLDFVSFGILRYWPGTSTLRLIVEKGDLAAKKYAPDFKVTVGISWYM
jgi:hypothetical protein